MTASEVSFDIVRTVNATMPTTPNSTEGEEVVTSPISGQEAEAVEFLTELVKDGLARESVLKRDAATSIVNVLENVIRTAWHISDVKRYLVGSGEFEKWVEAHLDMGLGRCRQLRRLGERFSRDMVDAEERKRLAIFPPGLDVSVGPHLRNQLQQTGCTSLNQLLICSGVLPAPQPQPQLTAGENGNRPIVGGALAKRYHKAGELLENLQAELNRLDPFKLSEEQKHELAERMRKLLSYFQAIKDS
jgi:hypothetical protein